ncbi:MAG: hypothetical protein Q8L23_08675 [Caulobacter sp.]|nr:hypothetical protein [Caulobacter sp.]
MWSFARTDRRLAPQRGEGKSLLLALTIAVTTVALGLMVLDQARLSPAEIRHGLERDLTRFAKPVSKADQEAVEARARVALRQFPLESQAVSLLAVSRQSKGRLRDADQLFSAAWALSHRNSEADLWLFQRAMSSGRFADGFLHADSLLRRERGVRELMYPTLLGALNDPKAMEPLVDRLRNKPGWRSSFFALGFAGPAPQRAAAILWALQDSGSPASKDEVEAYLNSLVARKLYEEAYVGWTLFLPGAELAKITGVHDGGFSGLETFAPFGWRIESGQGGGATVELEGPGDGGALKVVRFGGTTQFFARQLLVLAPGAYQITVRTRADGEASPGVLEWALFCAEDDSVLARTPVRARPGAWSGLALSFRVPPQGCSGQVLKLLGASPGSAAEPSIWFDDLALTQSGLN